MTGYLQPVDRLPGESAETDAVMTDERAALQGFLAKQRELVVWKVAGLSAEQHQQHATPSGLTAPGVMRHLALVERIWFRDRVAREPGLTLPQGEQDWDDQFLLPEGATTDSVIEEYAAECAAADAAIRDIPLDSRGPAGPSLRWVYLHMIEETARHLGHIDLLRERADGMTGEDPMG